MRSDYLFKSAIPIALLAVAWCAVFGLAPETAAQTTDHRTEHEFLTRAEATDYQQTSRYDDVISFVSQIAAASDRVHLTHFGYSYEGRALPLVVLGDVTDASSESVLACGKIRVYIQANIHAGEVCGKEAAQIFIRNFAHGMYPAWSDSVVVLVAPIYNADGNERINLANRSRQNGPVGGMGQRRNAQDLDLNRDHMKLESPEARSLARLLTEYDPQVSVDLHTTNGSHHAYRVTYSSPLNPNTHPAITEILKGDDGLLTFVTEQVKAKYGFDFYYYGYPRDGSTGRGWYTYDHKPRFGTGYIGLRNRLGILCEAYSYSPFAERIKASLAFVEETVAYSYRNANHIRAVTAQADRESIVGQELSLRAAPQRSAEPVEILAGEVEQIRNPYTGNMMLQRLDVVQPELMYEYGTFYSTEDEVVPMTYFVPGDLRPTVDRLTAHGVQMGGLSIESIVEVQEFAVDSLQTVETGWQQLQTTTLFGHYETVTKTLPAGTVTVAMNQPLARLIFYLLEPRSDDGLVTWNFLNEASEAGAYPIVRSVTPVPGK